jgi:hypothetical protein
MRYEQCPECGQTLTLGEQQTGGTCVACRAVERRGWPPPPTPRQPPDDEPQAWAGI